MKFPLLLILVFSILVPEVTNGQIFPLYQRPQLELTAYQKLYAGNLVKNTQNFQIKGNVKSATITLISATNTDSAYNTEKNRYGIKSSIEIHKYDFLPNNNLHTYEVKSGHEYFNNYQIDTATEITIYHFNERTQQLMSILKTNFSRSNDKRFTETNFDNSGFKESLYYYGNSPQEKELYHTETCSWNKKRTVVRCNYNYIKPALGKGHNKYNYRAQSHIKHSYSDIVLIKKDPAKKSILITTFDKQGNIISVLSDSPKYGLIKGAPQNYTISYEYNENNELKSVQAKGSNQILIYDNNITTFEYNNYDQQGNWQEITIRKEGVELKYKRTITYY